LRYVATMQGARLSLTAKERSKLEEMVRSPDALHRRVRQARAALLLADGVSVAEAARQCEVSPTTIRAWRRQFTDAGFSDLGVVAAGRGRKPAAPSTVAYDILQLTTTEPPPDGKRRWTTRTVARRLGVTKDIVAQVWRDAGVAPWLESTQQSGADSEPVRRRSRFSDTNAPDRTDGALSTPAQGATGAHEDTQARTLLSDVRFGSGARMPKTAKRSDLLAQLLVNEIVEQQLPSGHRLPPQAEMITKYGVGRETLREALRILEVHGLISMKTGPDGGARVADVSGADLGRTLSLFMAVKRLTYRELLEARLLLEPNLARLAAERVTPAIRESMDNLVRIAIESPPTLSSLDAHLRFHQVVHAAANNGVLDVFVHAIVDLYVSHRLAVRSPASGVRDSLRSTRDHQMIAAAISEGDGAAAETLMREHLEGLAESVLNGEDRWMLDQVVQWQYPMRPVGTATQSHLLEH
jgi:GntR family transcriptional regulator, transcriptional repressor for pyruvate dehydrogenase complex